MTPDLFSTPPRAVKLEDGARLAWLRLIRTDGVGPRTFKSLVNRFGGAAAALEALPDLARRAGRSVAPFPLDKAERELAQAARRGVRFVATGEADYPALLAHLSDSPPLLAVAGDAGVLKRPSVAVVGSRNASAAGLTITERVAGGLGQAGYVVVSGLARGVDARAHAAALRTGTIAVLAGGHARVYPDENRPLLERIVGEGGAAVSEMPLEWEPRGRDFPRRNRLVSGLALGLVVVEAAKRSGSLITARFALEQGREVFAVPGSPLDPRAEGPNELIRDGATLVRNAHDVAEALEAMTGSSRGLRGAAERTREMGETDLWDEMEWEGERPTDTSETRRPLERPPQAPPAPHSYESDVRPGAVEPTLPVAERVHRLLGPVPVEFDALVRTSGVPAREVAAVLLELELARRARRRGGSWARTD